MSLGMPMPPSFRVGKRRLFIKSDVEKWLQEQKAESVAAVIPASSMGLISDLQGGPAMT